MKKTVGQLSQELLTKAEPVHIEDQTNEILKDWHKHMQIAIDEGRTKFRDNFFIEIKTKKERLMENVLRCYWITRRSCPTPNYEQIVYKYNYKDESIEEIWSIPDRESCFIIYDNAIQLPADQRELVQYVFDFADGTLYKRMRELNNETHEVIL